MSTSTEGSDFVAIQHPLDNRMAWMGFLVNTAQSRDISEGARLVKPFCLGSHPNLPFLPLSRQSMVIQEKQGLRHHKSTHPGVGATSSAGRSITCISLIRAILRRCKWRQHTRIAWRFVYRKAPFLLEFDLKNLARAMSKQIVQRLGGQRFKRG